MRNSLNIIVAVDEFSGFGKSGHIPWHSKKDFKHFKEVTKNSICIMGRKTYEEIAEKAKPKKDLLAGRVCYVLSRNEELEVHKGCSRMSSLQEALDDCKSNKKEIFILGGERLFIQSLCWTDNIYMTIMEGNYNCDRFFPLTPLLKSFILTEGKEVTEDKKNIKFVTYKRIRP